MTCQPPPFLNLDGATPRDAYRFWSKVDIKGPDECWMWTAHTTDRGYGTFSLLKAKRSPQRAHRVAYYLAHGEFPNICCHTCDEPSCVNPAHLYSGTHKENAADRDSRGRANTAHGDEHYKAKLTAEKAAIIRDSSAPYEELSRRFGVSLGAINDVKSRRTWTRGAQPREIGKRAKLTEGDVREIRASADKTTVLMARYGVSKSTIGGVRSGHSWKSVK